MTIKNKPLKIACFVVGASILFVFILMAAFPQIFTKYGPKEMFDAWEAPSMTHILGTNDMGYDVFTEIAYGAATTLYVGLLAGFLSIAIGTFFGVLASKNNVFGHLANGFINVFLLLPKLVVLIVLCAFLPSTNAMRIVLIAAFSWVGTAREVRAKTMSLHTALYVQNCTVLGYSKLHTALRHIVPNLYDVLLAHLLVSINSSIMMQSTLGFLGMGDLYRPDWGTIIGFAYKRGAFLRQAYNWLIVPGIAISLVVLAFYLLSLALKKHD